tara:strand:+ start:4186 stop:5235 length:1050 start_codon:yes stop_codon:yes gene_type:complete
MKNILIIFFFIFSCKSEDKNIDITNSLTGSTENQITLDENFKIVFDGVFMENDLFLVFYTEKEGENFSKEKTLKKEILGSPNKQKVIFTFPEGVKPISLRIDFSDRKNQNHVKFLSLAFLDKYNRLIINKSNLDHFFSFNRYMHFQKEKGLLIGNIFKIDNKDAYNPYMVSNSKFNKVLKNLHKASSKKLTKTLINDLVNIDVNDGQFRFIIKGIFKKNDLIVLFYQGNTVDKFELKKSLSLNVQGSNYEQDLVFVLPKGRSAAKFRLDISNTNKQTGIEIKKIQIIKGRSNLIINKEELKLYFYANKYISFEPDSGDFICKTIIENGIDTHNPYFVSTPKMIEALLEF